MTCVFRTHGDRLGVRRGAIFSLAQTLARLIPHSQPDRSATHARIRTSRLLGERSAPPRAHADLAANLLFLRPSAVCSSGENQVRRVTGWDPPRALDRHATWQAREEGRRDDRLERAHHAHSSGALRSSLSLSLSASLSCQSDLSLRPPAPLATRFSSIHVVADQQADRSLVDRWCCRCW